MKTPAIENIKAFEEVASIPPEMVPIIGDTLVFVNGKIEKVSTRKLIEYTKEVLKENSSKCGVDFSDTRRRKTEK